MFCSNCGIAITTEAKFCCNCGANVGVAPTSSERIANNNEPSKATPTANLFTGALSGKAALQIVATATAMLIVGLLVTEMINRSAGSGGQKSAVIYDKLDSAQATKLAGYCFAYHSSVKKDLDTLDIAKVVSDSKIKENF